MSDEEDTYEHAEIPQDIRQLRACLVCTLVKNFNQFYDSGCDNCPFLEMEEDRQRIADCTTAYFDGLISMMQPTESWVARWQRIGMLKPGCYAVEVNGSLPEPVVSFLEEKGIPYRAKAATDTQAS